MHLKDQRFWTEVVIWLDLGVKSLESKTGFLRKNTANDQETARDRDPIVESKRRELSGVPDTSKTSQMLESPGVSGISRSPLQLQRYRAPSFITCAHTHIVMLLTPSLQFKEARSAMTIDRSDKVLSRSTPSEISFCHARPQVKSHHLLC